MGHVYQGRYKSILVDKEAYLTLLSRYIHLNPIQTRLLAKASLGDKMNYLRRYCWSSLLGYLEKRKKESFIEYAVVLREYGGETERGRRGYQRVLYGDLVGGLEIKGAIVGQRTEPEWVIWDCGSKNIMEIGTLHQVSEKLLMTENNFLYLIQ
jgi:hypothetical protein